MTTGRKHHSHAEISAKLTEAAELAASGKTQSEIGSALGISVMTYHRWRKLLAADSSIRYETAGPRDHANAASPGQPGRLAELQLENLMLRRLVPDLLLENAKLEETYGHNGRQAVRDLARQGGPKAFARPRQMLR